MTYLPYGPSPFIPAVRDPFVLNKSVIPEERKECAFREVNGLRAYTEDAISGDLLDRSARNAARNETKEEDREDKGETSGEREK